MNAVIKKHILPGLFLISVTMTSCSVDPLSPEVLQGQWFMLTFTDKETGITFTPGDSVDLGNGIKQTIGAFIDFSPPGGYYSYVPGDARMMVLTITTSTTIPGSGTDRDRESITGIYTIEDSTLTVHLDQHREETEEIRVFTIRRAGLRLTLEDDARRITWGKVD